MADAAVSTLQDLLDHASLQPFAAFFVATAFDDVGVMLDMRAEEWDAMLDAVAAAAAQRGLVLSAGLRMRVVTRLRKERLRREEAREAKETGSVHDPILARPSSQADAAAAARQPADMSQLPDESFVTTSYACWQGLSCLSVHWAFCMALSFFCLCAGLLLFGTTQLQSGDVSDEQAGGWAFTRALMILAFTLCGVAFCMGGCAYYRNPAAAHCDALVCSDDSMFSCGALSACCSGAGLLLRQLSCPSCGSPDCSCSLPSCAGGDAHLPDCNCAALVPRCDQCYCPELDLPRPDCSCSCCPSCNGLRGCLYTTYKILCCQCQIQV